MEPPAGPRLEWPEQVDPFQEGDDLVYGLSGQPGGTSHLGSIEREGALFIGNRIEIAEDLAVAIALLNGNNVGQAEAELGFW